MIHKINNKILKIFASTQFFSVLALWLIILVSTGTLMQREIGLYESQVRIFSSFIIFYKDFIPLPGGQLTLILIAINLITSLFKKYLWKKEKIGVLFVHFGALIMLLGGGITSFVNSEGSMSINEGEHSNFFDDYQSMELVIKNIINDEEYILFEDKNLDEGEIVENKTLGIRVEILHYFKNLQININSLSGTSPSKGLLTKYIFNDLKIENEPSENRPGIIINVSNLEHNQDGSYGTFLYQVERDLLEIEGDLFYIDFRRKRTYLPFDLKLLNFTKVLHPGTNMPKSFSSEILLTQDSTSRKVLIEMNNPLRFNKYVFYQSSYIDSKDKETSVLAVVKNSGRLFPYISTITMTIGLFIHILIHFFKKYKIKKN